jgi:hypothetical protein
LHSDFLSVAFLRDPHVNILIKEFGTQGISVLGEVVHPGIYPMLGSRCLFDVISAAGGMTNRAGKTIVITHRDQPSDSSVITLAKDAREAARQNAELQPGDTVMGFQSGNRICERRCKTARRLPYGQQREPYGATSHSVGTGDKSNRIDQERPHHS